MAERKLFKARSSASPDHHSPGSKRFPLLVPRGHTWIAKMRVPLPLQVNMGRVVFARSTGENDVAKAWAKAEPWIKEWKERIAAARPSGDRANADQCSNTIRTAKVLTGPPIRGDLGQEALSLKIESRPFQSPIGIAHWPSLNRTEVYKGYETGNYTLRLILEGDALAHAKKEVGQFLNDAYGARTARWIESPFRVTKPKPQVDGGPKTILTFRTRALDKYGKPRTVALYDSKGNLVERKVNLGSGSLVRVNGTIQAFSFSPGVAFYMDSVQIISPVEPSPIFGPVDDPDGFVG